MKWKYVQIKKCLGGGNNFDWPSFQLSLKWKSITKEFKLYNYCLDIIMMKLLRIECYTLIKILILLKIIITKI